jgi:hypothetical protein
LQLINLSDKSDKFSVSISSVSWGGQRRHAGKPHHADHRHPLRATLAKAQRTSQGDYPAIELVVVEVVTSDGVVGFGEGWPGAARPAMRG